MPIVNGRSWGKAMLVWPPIFIEESPLVAELNAPNYGRDPDSRSGHMAPTRKERAADSRLNGAFLHR
jgi:hypothetical protein